MTTEFLERLLERCLNERDREVTLGDLRELATRNPERATRLYLGELMTTLSNATQRPLAFILALGTLGGAALIVTLFVTSRGPIVFLPYAAIVLTGLVYLRVERVRPFAKRFTLSLGSFMLATIVFYVFNIARSSADISILGHAWRLGFMLAVGSVLGAAVAQLSSTTTAS